MKERKIDFSNWKAHSHHNIIELLSEEKWTIKKDKRKKKELLLRKNVVYKEIIVIYKPFCLDVTQGQMNGAPNETQTHSCRFASQAC